MDARLELDVGETTRRFEVSLPVSNVAVSIARSLIRRITTFVSDDAESSYLVALTEVIGNAVDEHGAAGLDAPILVVVDYEDADVVRVIDQGRGMSEQDRARTPAETTAESGRGLALARAFVPDMTFDTSDTGTTVTLPLAGLGIIR